MILNSAIFEKPSCKFKFLQREGFFTPQFYEINNTNEALSLYKGYMVGDRDKLDYDIDVLVQEVDEFESQKELGYQPSGLVPKFATSIKFDSTGAITKLKDIRWSVGMTGKIIPTGIFEPIDIMGVTITKASLHNYELLKKMMDSEGLKIDSECVVCRRGDVIPHMLGVKKSGAGKHIQIIECCPECEEKLVVFSVNLVCENMSCPAKTKGIFTNMFNTLDIKGISDKFVEKATELFDISTIDELMSLTVDEIESMPGFAKKSAQKAFDAIHSVKEITPEQFFALLNIPNQGVRVFENLFSQFPMEKLLDNSFKPEDILDTKGIADKTANAIYDGIQSNLERIRENAKWFKIIQKGKIVDATAHKSKIVGKSFCITGTLNEGTRKDYEEMIVNAGGKIAAVTKNLDFLVTNDEDTSSSKMKKTIELNAKAHNDGMDKRILIVSEADLRTMLEIN